MTEIDMCIKIDIDRMKEAIASPTHKLPDGIGESNSRIDFIRENILACGRNTNKYKCNNCSSILKEEVMVDTQKEQVKVTRKVSSKKQWNKDILTEGGTSHYHLDNLSDNASSSADYKDIYRVAMTGKDCDTLLKWRIKTASNEIFSVAAKSESEAREVIGQLFGFGKYSISQLIS